MLVLSRCVQETIVIDGNIRITLVAVGRDRVRLGIEAPAHVRVNRQEVQERLARAKDSSKADGPLVVTA